MRPALAFLPLALLFIANVVPSKAQSDAATSTLSPVSTTKKPVPERAPLVPGSDSEPGALQYYDVVRNTTLSCALANPSKLPVVWEKNNTEIAQVPELKDRFKLEDGGARFIIPRTIEEDYGNYTCKIGGARLNWQLHARPYTKLPSTDTSVVEGQKLKLVCRLIGKPAVPVEWYYNKFHTSYDPEEKELGVKIPVEGDTRIVLSTSDAGVVDGELTIESAVREDAGAYACAPTVVDDDARTAHDPARTVLRVKDMYAALWPFLGICAEVLVLCAIILVYEKRRTKPEMDDSDTDNHDQKKS